jgi:hypothetical protein
MEDHYDQREALHAIRQAAEDLGHDDVPTREAWVIRFGQYHFEYVQKQALWALEKSDGRVLWMDRHRTHCQDEDIFDTELKARNELEQRLYKRLLDLQKHREAMSKMLVAAAFPLRQEGA